MSKTPRTNTIAPIGYARAQDLLLYREVWAGYSNKPADENGHPPVALYTQDQVNAMLTAERERADRNQEDALTLMRALIKVRQQMFPQHDQRAVVSRDFPKLAAIDSARRK